jgi:hypothetical protein
MATVSQFTKTKQQMSDIAILRETLFGSWDRFSPPNDSTDATAMLKSSID